MFTSEPLTPRNGVKQKSFYNKSHVFYCQDGTKLLKSYDTFVMCRKKDGTLMKMWCGWTNTTGKHIKAFCGLNKKEYEKLEYTNINIGRLLGL